MAKTDAQVPSDSPLSVPVLSWMLQIAETIPWQNKAYAKACVFNSTSEKSNIVTFVNTVFCVHWLSSSTLKRIKCGQKKLCVKEVCLYLNNLSIMEIQKLVINVSSIFSNVHSSFRHKIDQWVNKVWSEKFVYLFSNTSHNFLEVEQLRIQVNLARKLPEKSRFYNGGHNGWCLGY